MLKQELTTNKQIVGVEEQKYKREGKGHVLAISRRLYQLQNSDIYYVESESWDNIYYYVKFKRDVVEYCSCLDNSMRGQKCKHLHSIEFAIRLGTIKDTDKLPADAKQNNTNVTKIGEGKSYTEDDYSF